MSIRPSARRLAMLSALLLLSTFGVVNVGVALLASPETSEAEQPALGRTLPADDVIFLQMFRPHRDPRAGDLPWIISGRMIPVTEHTPESEVAFLARWESLASAFANLTNDRSPSYDGQFASRLHAVAKVAVAQLGARPAELLFRRTVFRLLGEAGVLRAIRETAESSGSRPVDAVPDWAWENIKGPTADAAAPALTVCPTLPEPKQGCARIFEYCPRKRALTLQTLGDATLPDCLELHRDLTASRPSYRKRVHAVLADLRPLAARVDPASAESIRSFTAIAYERLESAGIAGELQDAFDGRMTRPALDRRRVP